MTTAPPDWYPDPSDSAQWRYWDGTQWTDHTAPRLADEEAPNASTQVASSDYVEARVGDLGQTAPTKKKSRFVRELFGNKEERAEAKAERLELKAEAMAELKKSWSSRNSPGVRAGAAGTRRNPDGTASDDVLEISSFKELLAALKPGPSFEDLDEEIEVQGENYHRKNIAKVFSNRATEITPKGIELNEIPVGLVPDTWNEYDETAVAVTIDGHRVGYLPRDIAEDYFDALMDMASSGLMVTGEGRVWARVDEGGVLRSRITIWIPEVDELENDV